MLTTLQVDLGHGLVLESCKLYALQCIRAGPGIHSGSPKLLWPSMHPGPVNMQQFQQLSLPYGQITGSFLWS